MILSVNHWTIPAYRQRVTTEQWRGILLNGGDNIIFRGHIVPLVAVSIWPDVYEIYKNPQVMKTRFSL